MSTDRRSFVPAAGRDWLLPFYDPLCRLLGARKQLEAFVAEAGIEPGQRILDVGCGTGNLVLAVARLHPGAEVRGIDPDPLALARARRKVARAGLHVPLDRGFAQELPYPDASFDRVLSSFVFHHLDLETKAGMLREARRVLAPGGSLHLVDFGDHGGGWLAQLVHSREGLRDNAEERVLGMMREAGLGNPSDVAHRTLLRADVVSYRAAA